MNQPRDEHNYFIELRGPHKVNGPWLENKSMQMEDALIERMPGRILGPSVTANFDINGFEIDLTVSAATPAEQQQYLSEAMQIVQEIGEISIPSDDDKATEIRSEFVDDSVEPDTGSVLPATC